VKGGDAMGAIYKRGNRWWIKYYKDGKPYRESSKSSKKGVAERLLKKREGEVVDGKTPGSVFAKVKFDELAADLLTDYKHNGRKTTAWVERKIRLHLKPFLGGMPVPHITTAKIKEYTNQRLKAEAKPATINRELAALKRMLKLGYQETKVKRIPHIPMLREDNVRKGFLERDQFLALWDALPDHMKGPVTFAYKTGWRSGEIRGLTWEQVDRKAGIVRLEVGDTKNQKGRTVYLDTELKALISERFQERRLGCPYVFHKDGEKIEDFRPEWKAACKATGLTGRLFHDLRRTAIRNMVRSGISERVAMQISGHRTRSTFDRYNIVSASDLQEAAKKHERYIDEL
jgi:integrase